MEDKWCSSKYDGGAAKHHIEVFYSHEDRWCGATEIMIKEGYGVAYHGQSKEDIEEEHIANRTKLKENGIIT